jgi:ABC-type antimicrobial peptide transport system permease subunit
MALGAGRGEVAALIMREVALLGLGGVALGVPIAMLLTRYVRAQLFGLSPLDPVTIAGTVLLLATVALVSGYLPARRATNVSPTTALRYE